MISPTYVSPTKGAAIASAWCNVFPHAKNIERFGFNLGHYFPSGTTTATIANVDPDYITASKQARSDKTVDPRLWEACLKPSVESMVENGDSYPISLFLDFIEIE